MMVINKILLYSIYLRMMTKTNKTNKTIKTITGEKVDIIENISIELPRIYEDTLKATEDINVKEQVEEKIDAVEVAKEQVEEKIDAIEVAKEQVEEKIVAIEVAKEQVEEKIYDTKEMVEEVVEVAKEQVQDKVNDILYDLADGADKLINKLEDKLSTELTSAVAEMATNVVEEINGSKSVCVKCMVSCIFPLLKSVLNKKSTEKPTEVKALPY
jgi:phage-related minor tail protein